MIQQIQQFASFIEHQAPGFVDIAVKGAVVLVLACLLAACARRASAAARHWILLLGFLGLLILPLLSSTLPGWKILPRMANESLSPTVDNGELPALTATGTRVVPNELENPSSATSNTQTPASKARPLSVSFLIFCVWAAGVVVFAGRVLLGYLSLAILRRKCTVIRDDAWINLLGDLCEEMNINHEIQLLKSPLRSMPMTWGLRKMHLLLPEQANDWAADQRRSVLLHELAHVARRDCLAQVFVQVAFAMHWFNPLAWIAGRQLQIERERACDDLALSAGAKATDYADHLLKSAVALPAMPFVAAALAMARPSTLEGRLKAILDGNRNRKPLTLGGAIIMIGVLGTMLVPVAALKAQQKEAAPAKEPEAAVASPAFEPLGGMDVGFTPPPRPPENKATCKMDAIIFSVQVPADKIGLLDVDELSKSAANVADFEKALAKYGECKPLYRANQTVQLASDSISIQTQNPYVTNTQTTPSGEKINSVSYTNTGASFNLAGTPQDGQKINLRMEISLSALTDSATDISSTLKAPTFRSAKLTHKGIVEIQKPFLIMSIDGASANKGGMAEAYITRVVLSDLKK